MRFEREASISLNPDGARPPAEAAPHIGRARVLLGNLFQECELNSIPTLFRTHRLQDGTLVRVGKVGDSGFVGIKTFGGEEEESQKESAIFIARYYSTDFSAGLKDEDENWLYSLWDFEERDSEWKYREEQDQEGVNVSRIDWYDGDGIVLTISSGSSGRYGSAGSWDRIFNNGEIRAELPDTVEGVAVTKAGNGGLWFVAICRSSDTYYALAAPYKEEGKVEESGWQTLATYNSAGWDPSSIKKHAFFNKSGNHATLCRTYSTSIGTHRLDVDIDIDALDATFTYVALDDYMKKTITRTVDPGGDGTPRKYEIGTWTPYTGNTRCNPASACHLFETKAKTDIHETWIYSGQLLWAVDYDGDSEIPAYFKVENTGSGDLILDYYYSATFQERTPCPFNTQCVPHLETYDSTSISDVGSETFLMFGNEKIRIAWDYRKTEGSVSATQSHPSTFPDGTSYTFVNIGWTVAWQFPCEQIEHGVPVEITGSVGVNSIGSSRFLALDLRTGVVILDQYESSGTPTGGGTACPDNSHETFPSVSRENFTVKVHAGLGDKTFFDESSATLGTMTASWSSVVPSFEGEAGEKNANPGTWFLTTINSAISPDEQCLLSYYKYLGPPWSTINLNVLYDASGWKSAMVGERQIDEGYTSASLKRIALW